MLPMAGRTAGPIKTKLGIGTHVDPGSVLVKVKVMWCHLVNGNKTPDRGPQEPREFEREARELPGTEARRAETADRARSAINLRPEDGYLQL